MIHKDELHHLRDDEIPAGIALLVSRLVSLQQQYGSDARGGRASIALTQALGAANAALADSDPRKITRESVELVRRAANDAAERSVEQIAAPADRLTRLREDAAALYKLADALDPYLTPATA